MKEILDLLMNGGPYGVIAALVWAVRHLYSRLEKEHTARLDDQKAATQALLGLNDRVHQALDRTAEMVEAMQKAGTRIQP